LVADRTECFIDFDYSIKYESLDRMPHFILVDFETLVIDVMPHSQQDLG